MKQQAFNPYLPGYEYVPDGEPHIFDGRLYVFGSHDAFNGKGFCINDYVCWSASPDSLGEWKYEGVIYRRMQDPLNRKGRAFMNAPDVVRGADGRYYLYYQLNLECVTSVAVAEKPAKPYDFYGQVRHADGVLYGKKKGDAYNFDPGLLMDDDGSVYMYTGFSPTYKAMRFVMGIRGGTFEGGSVVKLQPDMLTIDGNEMRTIPGELEAAGTGFEGHGFFEASSIRKINGIYYLVYSSALSHELCCAVSDTPAGPWKYGGTLISIGDIGLPGVTAENARNFTGNTHGGMVCVKGQWYIFYHRQTNQQKCARQGCAEPIQIEADGSIRQAEMTSCGLNGGPLSGTGTYEARIACNLRGAKGTFAYVRLHHKEKGYPYFTQSGTDREQDGDQYIANMQDGAIAGYKYFLFAGENRITVNTRGQGSGKLMVYTESTGMPAAEIPVSGSEDWKSHTAGMAPLTGKQPLYFVFRGSGSLDFYSFAMEKFQEVPQIDNRS